MMISPGHGGSEYAFRHTGERNTRYRAMLQRLDPDCFMEGTRWVISAYFRYFIEERGSDPKFVLFQTCNKADHTVQNSCPVLGLDFVSGSETIRAVEQTNESLGGVGVGEWPLDMLVGDDGWHEIRHTVTITAEMALLSEVWLYVNSVDPAHNYDIDDVRMVRA